jgi:diguanylate cyclase (GGDEF)-like protein
LGEASLVADKLRLAIAAADLPGGREQPAGRLTVSLGVSQLEASDSEDGDSLIERTDQALYAAKHAGRNQVSRSDAPPKLVTSVDQSS